MKKYPAYDIGNHDIVVKINVTLQTLTVQGYITMNLTGNTEIISNVLPYIGRNWIPYTEENMAGFPN